MGPIGNGVWLAYRCATVKFHTHGQPMHDQIALNIIYFPTIVTLQNIQWPQFIQLELEHQTAPQCGKSGWEWAHECVAFRLDNISATYLRRRLLCSCIVVGIPRFGCAELRICCGLGAFHQSKGSCLFEMGVALP